MRLMTIVLTTSVLAACSPATQSASTQPAERPVGQRILDLTKTPAHHEYLDSYAKCTSDAIDLYIDTEPSVDLVASYSEAACQPLHDEWFSFFLTNGIDRQDVVEHFQRVDQGIHEVIIDIVSRSRAAGGG